MDLRDIFIKRFKEARKAKGFTQENWGLLLGWMSLLPALALIATKKAFINQIY